jgi:hypothetical protein
VAVALLKLLKPHLALGVALAEMAHLHGGMGLNGRETGKVVAELGLGAICLGGAVVARRLAEDLTGVLAALLAVGLVAGLAVAGGLSDFAYMALAGRIYGATALLGLAEGAGEMLVVSLAGLGFVALCRTAASPCPRPRVAAI